MDKLWIQTEFTFQTGDFEQIVSHSFVIFTREYWYRFIVLLWRYLDVILYSKWNSVPNVMETLDPTKNHMRKHN